MSVKFIRSPLFYNWIKKTKPSKSIIICTAYLKKYALEQIVEKYKLDDENSNITLEILIRGKLEEFINGSSDISALELLSRLKCKKRITRLTNLHMKAYLIDEKELLIGSGNCTQNGLFAKGKSGNVEAAISTDDPDVIKEFLEYYKEIVTASEDINNFYETLVNEYHQYIKKNSAKKTVVVNISQFVKVSESNAKYNFQKPHEPENEDDSIIDSESKFDDKITVEDIPQYSNFEDGAFRVVEILSAENDRGVTFSQLGLLFGQGNNDTANKKYGENHSKLAELLDLVSITNERPRKIYLTKLGKKFNEADKKQKIEILINQVTRMNIIKDIIEKCQYGSFNLFQYLNRYLSAETAKRRKSNVKKLFGFLKDNGVVEIDEILRKL